MRPAGDERIVVLTSNHPERLDPALVRPGRIDRQIHLGLLRRREAEAMARHFFVAHAPPGEDVAAAEAELVACFDRCWADGVLTPAELECLCLGCDTLGEMLAAMEAKLAACA
jgi:SpoVK/Ycf46/Vps4 family AAA+-type ATPase